MLSGKLTLRVVSAHARCLVTPGLYGTPTCHSKVISSQQTDWTAKELLSILLYSAALYYVLLKGRPAMEKEIGSGHQHEDRVSYKETWGCPCG